MGSQKERGRESGWISSRALRGAIFERLSGILSEHRASRETAGGAFDGMFAEIGAGTCGVLEAERVCCFVGASREMTIYKNENPAGRLSGVSSRL